MASVLPAPVNSKHHLILWTANLREKCGQKEEIWVCGRKLCCIKQHEGKKTLCAAERNNTNLSQSDKEFAPAPQHTQNDTNSPAGDLSHWWAQKQDPRKSGLKQNNENEEPPWDATMKFLNLNDTNHRRKPAQVMPDCGPGPRSLLKLTQSAPEAPGDEKFRHYVIYSVFSFQLLLRCPPLQIQLLGSLLELKTNRDETGPNLPNTTRRTIHTWLVTLGIMYCDAKTVLAWRALNFKISPGTTQRKRVTKVWMTSRLTKRIKH